MQPLSTYVATLEELGVTVTDASDISEETRPTFPAWHANVEAHASALHDLLGQRGVHDFVRDPHPRLVLERRNPRYGILAATKPS